MEEVVLQSDNARYYQNSVLLYGLMKISEKRNKVRITHFIHTETQDGKGSIDVHFAIAIVILFGLSMKVIMLYHPLS